MDKRPGWRKRIALELYRGLKSNRAKLHDLSTLYWECTLRCNLSCQHCGSDCHTCNDQEDMPIDDFIKVIDTITPHIEPNKLEVIFTGGEPLLRKDLEKCGLELFCRGFAWGIVSNGLLLDKKRLDSLLSAGMQTITIGLDGFEESHNWMRGHPKGFEKALDAICYLAEEKKITWDVVTRVNQHNFDQLKLFREFLIEMGVKRWRLETVCPSGKASDNLELQLTNIQFTWLMNFIRACRQDGQLEASYGCEGFLGNYEGEVRDQFFQCRAGISVASILADGSISGCPSIRANFHQGNIYRDNFMSVWEEGFEPYRNRKWTKKGQCAECEMYKYCDGNGMHLYDAESNLMLCHYKRLQ